MKKEFAIGSDAAFASLQCLPGGCLEIDLANNLMVHACASSPPPAFFFFFYSFFLKDYSSILDALIYI